MSFFKGEKIICNSCGLKYFDLGKIDVTCPRCGGTPERVKIIKKKNKTSTTKDVNEIIKNNNEIIELDDTLDSNIIEDIELDDNDILIEDSNEEG